MDIAILIVACLCLLGVASTFLVALAGLVACLYRKPAIDPEKLSRQLADGFVKSLPMRAATVPKAQPVVSPPPPERTDP